MKKLMVFFSVFVLSQAVFAARALVREEAEIYYSGNGIYRAEYNVVYAGNDVPGNVAYSSVSINIDSTTAVASIATILATAVRTQATGLGFTVPANQVFVSSYQAN